MTSLQTQVSFAAHCENGREDVKHRTKSTVKPALRKLRQSSRHSSDKKASFDLDLDLSWEEQAAHLKQHGLSEPSYEYPYGKRDEWHRGDGLSLGRLGASFAPSKDGRTADFSLDAVSGHGKTRTSTRTAKDVSFSLLPTEPSHGRSDDISMRRGGAGGGGGARGAWNDGGAGRGGTGAFSGSGSRSASVLTATSTAGSANAAVASIASSKKYPPPAHGGFGTFSSSPAPAHHRSTSAASHNSSATAGSFVHPSKQIPRTSTPPLSLRNSPNSLEQVAAARDAAREYSASLQKDSLDEDNVPELDITTTTTGSYRNSLSDANSRPPLSRQQTSSSDQALAGSTGIRSISGVASRPPFLPPPPPPPLEEQEFPNGCWSEVTKPLLLATPTTKLNSDGRRPGADGPRLPVVVTSFPTHASIATTATSAIDPNVNLDFSTPSVEVETPLTAFSQTSTSAVTPMVGASHKDHRSRHSRTNSQSGTCNSVSSATSPLRTSLDMAGFRLRSRSEVDTAQRQEQIRAARRKFDEKEKAKDEEHFRRQQRKREKAEEKAAARVLGTDKHGSSSRRSATFGARPSASLDQHRPSGPRRAATFSSASASVSASVSADAGVGASASGGGDRMLDGEGAAYSTRQAEDVHFQAAPKRRKGNGSWTSFMLWFRVKIFRLGKR